MSITVQIDDREAQRVLALVESGNGFATVTLGDLKVVVGVSRLGKYVLEDIRSWLKRNSLGYFPRETLEENQVPRQDQQVRIYRQDRTSALAGLVNAVLDPSPEGDRVLAGLTTNNSSAQRAEELQARIDRAKEALEDAVSLLAS